MCAAESVELLTVDSGNTQAYSLSIAGIELNNIFIPRGPEGGTTLQAYDLRVKILEKKAEPGDDILAEIIIINNWNVPDYDAIMTHYLITPDGRKVGETLEQIMEAPPGETKLLRSITLPHNASLGEWRFFVAYDTVIQPTVKAYSPFRVFEEVTFYIKYKTTINIIIGLIGFWFIFFYKRDKEEETKKKKRWVIWKKKDTT